MNSKQDILNAFRKQYGFTPGGEVYLIEPIDKIEQWLLKTLTEFEREIKIKAFNEFSEQQLRIYNRKKQRENRAEIKKEKRI